MESKSHSSMNNNHRHFKSHQDNLKIPLRLKKSSSNGLFRLFNKGISNNEKNTSEQLNEDPVAAGLRDIGLEVGLCNYIRPNGQKLEPRRESEYRRENVTSGLIPSPRRATLQKRSPANIELKRDENSGTPSQPKTSQAKETFRNRALNSQLVIKDPGSSFNIDIKNIPSPLWSPLLSPVTPVHATGLPAFASIKPQFVVGKIAMDGESSPMWTAWLKSYSKGEFNIQNPPEPPPLGSTFTHLPAVYPYAEEMRSTANKIHEYLWNDLAHDRAKIYLREVTKKFGTRFGAISFFDEESEVCKTEKGYSVKRIQRSNSIAAHALYSTEVFAILDTKTDWRFRGNPMVLGKPHIRFFAATPLVNSDGDILGVLSIFSQEKREIFTYDQRRQLAEHGASLTTELMARIEHVKMPHTSKIIPSGSFQISPSGLTFANRVSQPQGDSLIEIDQIHKNVNVVDRYAGRDNPLPPPPVPPPPVPKNHTFGQHAQPVSQNLTRPSTGRSRIIIETTPPPSVKSSKRPSIDAARDLPLRSRVNSTVSKLETRPRGDSLTLSYRTTSTSRPSSRPTSKPTSRPTSRITSKTYDENDSNPQHLTYESAENFEDSSCSPLGNISPASQFQTANDVISRSGTMQSFLKDLSSYEFETSSSRPFSSSELMTLEPTPHTSSEIVNIQNQSCHPNLNMTVEDFLSLSDGDLTEDSVGILSNETNSNNFNPLPTSISDGNDIPEGRYSENHHKSNDYDNHYKLETNVNISMSSSHESNTKISDSLLKWKFPRSDPKLPSNDSLTNNQFNRGDCSPYQIDSLFDTTSSSPMRNC
ncbi:putative gaf domain-containing protein [Erysiphe neolycopersici]|uniref:Putative gaf domain-containing protein n=1 Tax=Erysiphe neolycopersici TaxID=212602 RepID=A0A420I6J7_9PEZI|nr:putative gaf domain-containing protein [Erysiphe neolycopersici]